MVLVKCLCLLAVTVLVFLVEVNCDPEVSLLSIDDESMGLSAPSGVDAAEALNKSFEAPTEKTKDAHTDESTGRGRIVRKRKHLLRMLLHAKMVAAAIFVPGVIALSVFASWKSAFFSIMAFVMALAALLRPQAWGGREYSHATEHHIPVHSSDKVWTSGAIETTAAWPQRVQVDQFGQHKALLHVIHHGGKKEDHHHDHHVWYHDSPSPLSDHDDSNSYSSDPYHGWSSR